MKTYVSDFVETREWLSEVSVRDVLEKRLQDEYEKVLKPEIDEFRNRLRDVDIATVAGALAIQVSIPSVLSTSGASLGLAIPPVGGLLAGAALALAPIFRDRRKAQREQKRSPMAYLMHLERDLKPRKLTDWNWERSRQFRPAT